MAHAWKACWVQALGGSNPPSSASSPLHDGDRAPSVDHRAERVGSVGCARARPVVAARAHPDTLCAAAEPPTIHRSADTAGARIALPSIRRRSSESWRRSDMQEHEPAHAGNRPGTDDPIERLGALVGRWRTDGHLVDQP